MTWFFWLFPHVGVREILTRGFLSRGYLSVLTNFDGMFVGNLRISSTQCRKKYWHHRGTREFTCVLGWLCDPIMWIGRLTFNLHLMTPWHFIPVALRHSRTHCVGFPRFGGWFIIVTMSTNTLLSSNIKKLCTHPGMCPRNTRFFFQFGFFLGARIKRRLCNILVLHNVGEDGIFWLFVLLFCSSFFFVLTNIYFCN